MTRRALITYPHDVQVERPLFLKADWYPLDVVTIVAGRGGEGKSSLVLADVAAGSRGDLVGDVTGRARTLITAPEDAKGLQKARLIAAGARGENWAFLDVNRVDEDGELFDSTPVLPHDLHIIGDALCEFGANLWVIDPITSVIPGDLNKRDVVRAGLDPLTKLARDLHIAVVAIMHFNKGAGNASDKLSGSAAFRDVARSVLLVAHDKDSDERVITVDKSNYSEAAGKSWSFRLDSAEVADEAGEAMSVPRAVVVGETQTSVEEIINRQPEGADGDDRDTAAEWLRGRLSGPGGMLAADIKREASQDLACSWKTVQRAASSLGVQIERSGFPARPVWRLPVDLSSQAQEGGIVTGQPREDLKGQVSPQVLSGVTSADATIPPLKGQVSPQSTRSVSTSSVWTDPEWNACTEVAGQAQPIDAGDRRRWRAAGQPAITTPQHTGNERQSNV